MRCSPLNAALYSLHFRTFFVQIASVQILHECLHPYEMGPFTGGSMAIARLDIRLDKEIKAKAEKASALLGHKSLTEYVVRLMDEDATQELNSMKVP